MRRGGSLFKTKIALLQTQTLIETKKSHIKMLKMALLDCAINEKCYGVDGGRGICPPNLWPLRYYTFADTLQGKSAALQPS